MRWSPLQCLQRISKDKGQPFHKQNEEERIEQKKNLPMWDAARWQQQGVRNRYQFSGSRMRPTNPPAHTINFQSPSFLSSSFFFYKYSVSLDPPLTVRAQNSFGLEDNLGFLGIICVGKNCKSLFSIIWNVFRIFEMLLRVGRMPLPYFCNSLHLFKISSISTIFFHWDHFRKGIFFERDWFGTRPIPKDDLLELYGLFRGFSWCAPEFFL